MIVKIDDLGLYLLNSAQNTASSLRSFKRVMGKFLLRFAPILMKLLAIVGTAAMFLVGGGIIAHGVPFLHHFVEHSIELVSVYPSMNNLIGSVTGIALNGLIGIIAGLLAFIVIVGGQKLLKLTALKA
jgi:predicted DNA repair protein MutK